MGLERRETVGETIFEDLFLEVKRILKQIQS